MTVGQRVRLGSRLPHIRVAPPGPASRRWAKDLARYESPGVSGAGTPIVWREAHGANVVDADGNVYIDLTAAFAVANAGHANPRIVRAIQRQAGTLLHGLGDVHPSMPRLQLSKRLAEVAPIKNAQVIFCNSGSEAVEVALKTATLATGRHGFIAYERAFHGQTYGALAVTARPRFRQPFEGELNQRVVRVPYPNSYRCPLKREEVGCDSSCLAPVEQALESPPTHIGPIAAVIIEPIQGREGETLPPPDYLPRLKALCQRYGALLIVDEMMTGFGRTGRWFAVQHSGVEPDILCIGKAIAGGMPIAACIATANVMAAWKHNEPEAPHSSTFMGHPVGAAAALASIAELRERRLPERAATLGEWLLAQLRALQAKHPLIGDVRGQGLMIGIELVKDRRTKEPASKQAAAIMDAALKRGVILLVGGPEGHILSLTPPLTIARRQLAYALQVLDDCLHDAG